MKSLVSWREKESATKKSGREIMGKQRVISKCDFKSILTVSAVILPFSRTGMALSAQLHGHGVIRIALSPRAS